VVALTYLRRLELKLIKNGIRRTAADVMADLHKLHSVITLGNGRLSKRTLEQPSPSQMEIIKALGYEINQKWGLTTANSLNPYSERLYKVFFPLTLKLLL
jgi:hypothetical protein